MVKRDLWLQAIDEVFRPPQQPQPVGNNDLAQFLISHSFKGPTAMGQKLASKQGAESEKPSLLSKVFDVLAGSTYTAESTLGDLIDFGKSHHDSQNSNPIEDIFGPAALGVGSAIKHTAGTLARNAGEIMDIGTQVTGLDNLPVIGGASDKIESGLMSIGDKLTPRTMGSNNLEKLGVKNNVAKYGGGFALDVAVDPLTYLTGSGIAAAFGKNAAKVGETATQAVEEAAAKGGHNLIRTTPPALNMPPVAEEALGRNLLPKTVSAPPTLANRPPVSANQGLLQAILGDAPNNPQDLMDLQALRRTDNAKRAAEVRWGRDPDMLDAADWTPEQKGAFSDFMRDAKLSKAGKVTDGKGFVSQQGIARVIEDVSKGTVPRWGEMPLAAEGPLADRAAQVADEFANNLTKATRKGRAVTEITPADQANLYSSLRNAAAEMVNTQGAEKAAARAAKPLSNRQQSFIDEVNNWGKEESTWRAVSEQDVRNYVEQGIGNGAITKTDAKAVLRKLFPPEVIEKPAVTKLGQESVNNMARQMLRTAEDHLMKQGRQPVYWNGMRLRLSEVMQEIGPGATDEHLTHVLDAMMHSDTKAIQSPIAQEAIQRALARRSLSMSDILGTLSQKTLQVKKDLETAYNFPKPVEDAILKSLPEHAADLAGERGATLAESVANKAYIANIINADKLPLDSFFDRVGPELATAVMEGRATAEQVQKINKLVAKVLNQTEADFMTNVTGHKVIDGTMTRFSSYFGRQAEMKRYSSDVFGFAEENAAFRTQFLRRLKQNYSEQELNKGFILAQSPHLVPGETDPKVIEAYQVFKDYFDWMLGSTGFDKIVDLNGTPAVRSAMTMTDVNKNLKAIGSKFFFIDGKAKTRLEGITRDYSDKGVGWMRSWENANPTAAGQDPVSLLHDIDLALQRTVAEYNTYDEFAMRFGRTTKGNEYTSTIPHPRLQGYYFPKQTRDQFLRLIHDLEEGAWKPQSKAVRMAMQGTRAWKSSVTIYYPVHHIRNIIGDSFNTWLAGINDPTVYSRAAKVLETQKSRYGEALKSHDWDMMKQLLDKDALSLVETSAPKATDTIISTKRGVKISAEQLWASGFSRGLFRGYNKIEDLFGETPMGAIMKTTPEDSVMRRLAAPFGGRAHHVAARISEHREHYVRMAHYIGAVEKRIKSGERDLSKIFDDAAHEVRKWHPDGTELTQFEQKLRMVIPFYAWTRKEIPLLAQTMIQKPAKIVAYPKAQRAIAGMSGIDVNDDQGLLDPYPNNQLFPDWIRATGIGPIGDPESTNPVARFWAKFGATRQGLNGQEGYVNINPSNPFNDVMTQLFGFGNPDDSLRAISNSLNPGLGIPMDLLTNTTFSGAPITKEEGGQGYANYFASQIPQLGTVDRLFGAPNQETTQNQNQQNIMNFLTALGIRGTGPYEKSAEFEAKRRANNGG